MEELNNPAGRLAAILRKGQKLQAQQKALQAWASLLEVEESNKSLLLQRLGHVLALPEQIQKEMQDIPGINHERRLKWMAPTVGILGNFNLEKGWKDLMGRFREETIYGIEICSDDLLNRRPKGLEQDNLDELLERVNGLLSELETAGFAENVRADILDHLNAIKCAIEEYKLRGAKPIEAETERLLGALQLKAHLWFNGGSRGFWRGIKKLLQALILLNLGIEAGQQLIDKGMEAIEYLDSENEQDASAEESRSGKPNRPSNERSI